MTERLIVRFEVDLTEWFAQQESETYGPIPLRFDTDDDRLEYLIGLQPPDVWIDAAKWEIERREEP